MPEGLAVLEDIDGDLIIHEQNLDILSGINGSKVILEEMAEIIISNH